MCNQFLLAANSWPKGEKLPSMDLPVNKFCTGPKKPGMSWNFFVAFSMTGKSWRQTAGPGKFWKFLTLK